MNLQTNAHPELMDELQGFSKQKGHFGICISAEFESAHYLYHYFPDGSDEPVHGHSWQVLVYLQRADGGIGGDGISYDFLQARKRLELLAERIDHCLINELPEFTGINPTAENIARWFYQGLVSVVNKDGASIQKIQISEGPHNQAEFVPVYSPEK